MLRLPVFYYRDTLLVMVLQDTRKLQVNSFKWRYTYESSHLSGVDLKV